MAALLPNAAGKPTLAIPAPPVASFVQLFNDPVNDPLLGQYAGRFDSFAIDPVNVQASVSPQGLRDLVVAAGTQRNLVALLYINEGVSQVLLCPQHLDGALGAHPSNLFGNIYAFEGDLFHNQGFNVELPNEFFNLIPNQVLAPTAAFIQTDVTATPDLKFLGPFVNGDASTEIVRVRKAIPKTVPVCPHMAAINAGPLQLAMPAPPVASFVQQDFNDLSKDPLLFDSFAINPNNAQARVSPQALSGLVAAVGTQ